MKKPISYISLTVFFYLVLLASSIVSNAAQTGIPISSFFPRSGGTITGNVVVQGNTTLNNLLVTGITTLGAVNFVDFGATNGRITKATITDLGSTNSTITKGTVTNFSASNGSVTDFGSTNGTITKGTITNLSAANFSMTGTASGNFPKITAYDHGSQNGDYTIDLSMAEMHVVAFTAAANLTISSSRTNDKAMVVVKSGGAYNVNLKGVDNGATNLTAAANTQDLLGFTKAFGKITLGASALNYPTN